jgi:hypothetical protein
MLNCAQQGALLVKHRLAQFWWQNAVCTGKAAHIADALGVLPGGRQRQDHLRARQAAPFIAPSMRNNEKSAGTIA